MNDLSEFSMTRYRYAKRTRTLTQEQVDRYITEYDGDFDMQFVNGPMQQDQERSIHINCGLSESEDSANHVVSRICGVPVYYRIAERPI